MKSKFLVVAPLLAVLAISVSACGGPSPLTAEQKAMVKEVNQSAAATSASGPSNRQQMWVDVSEMASMAAYSSSSSGRGSSSGATTHEDSTESAANGSAFQEAIARAFNEGRCSVEGEAAPTSRSANAFAGFSVSGPRCPILMEMTVQQAPAQAELSQGDIRFKAFLKFQILDAELKRLNDVDQFSMTIEANMNVRQSGGGNATVRVDGEVHSLKYDTVKYGFVLTAEGDGRGAGKLQMTIRYEFKEFLAEGKADVDANGRTRYSINGQEATATEFDDVMSEGLAALGGGRVSMGASNSGTQPQPAPSPTPSPRAER
jgi:hypothetical protein